jgi:hypothetical protein
LSFAFDRGSRADDLGALRSPGSCERYEK